MNQAQLKAISVNTKLGAPIGSQDTVRSIYDTVASSGTRFEFFKNFNKTPLQCNITRAKLDVGETLVIQEILLCQETEAGADIFDNASLLNLTIGNQKVIKDLALQFETVGGLQMYPTKRANAKYISIPMITQIVIPPDTEFSANVEVSGSIAATSIKLVLCGYGRLFNSNAPY